MTEEKNKGFDDFLRKNLSHWDYEHLEELLEESPHMTTKIKNNPAIGGMNHLAVFVKLLKKWDPSLKAVDLMDRFGFGENTTTEEVRQLISQNKI